MAGTNLAAVRAGGEHGVMRYESSVVSDSSGRIPGCGYGEGRGPMPRRVRRRPYVQWNAPLAWTTLSPTLHADGRAEPALAW
jgi:hypothetical protein